MRDLKLAVRVGGGAGIGVLFFLIVIVLTPFAIGPDLALLGAHRAGDPVARRAARKPAHARPSDRRRRRGRLARPDPDRATTPLELAVAAKALAHWLTTGLPLVIATPLLGLLMNLDAQASVAVALTLLAGTPALTFIGLIGAALSVTLRRGGLLLAVLVLPLTVPVLIFGVAASNAAIVGPLPFGTPFTILCALTLVSLVVGTFAAAAALRHGME